MFKYFLLYKPFNVLSQFTDEGDKKGLGSVFDFPKDVYPVGRLDADSEGLLILTSDTRLNQKLLNPTNGHWRTYQIQVEGIVTDDDLSKLMKGVVIKVDGKEHYTRPAKARRIETPELPERFPPVRYRKTVPDTWIELSLTEGKNRQVRKMTAAVGFPTLRLVRVAIGNIRMENPASGKVVELDGPFVYNNMEL
jgi:23S rRNA pseudouridine2457 synthase